jgi:type II secretory pathway component PulF
MAQSSTHRRLQRASSAIAREISEGVNLESAMQEHKNTFTPFFLNTFFTGLRSGSLPDCLNILIEHYSLLMKLRSKIIETIAYPLAVLILGTIIMTARDLIIMFIHHAFNWREALPVISFYSRMLITGIFIPFLFSRVLKDRRVRPVSDGVIIHIPVFGKYYKRYAMAIFFRVFATGIEAGRNIRGSFRDALESMNNYYLARRLQLAERYLSAGESITEAFDLTGVFEPQALSMIAAGEASGSIPELSRKMAEYYFEEIINLMPGYIRAFFPLFIILVAIAFFLTPYFIPVALFSFCILIFLLV